MKKLLIVILLVLLTSGSVFAQWGDYGHDKTAQTLQTITGTLQIINGILAIVNASNQVYYVPNLQPYYGANGLYLDTIVTVYGNTANNYCEPSRFMVSGTWYNFPVYNYYTPPPKPRYAPPPRPRYTPPPMPRNHPGHSRPRR